MKQNRFLWVCAAATLLFAGCTKDLETGTGSSVVEGNEIQFGATDLATFKDGYSSQSGSRTVYGQSTYSEGKWHYPLKWVYGDQIAVYCPQASYPASKSANYTIEWENGTEGDPQEDGDMAYMMKVGENGLHWGNPSEAHTFYAFYPASLIENDKNFQNGVLHGSIPNVQEMTWRQDRGNWVGDPDMNYAFMRAGTTVDPSSVQDGKVKLEFTPLVTAVDITLTASSDMTGTASISQIQVMAANKDLSSRQAVCGDFTYDVDNNHTTVGSPDIATDYMITVSCWSKTGQPITLNPGNSLTFTVFLLPGSDAEGNRTLQNLKVSIPGWLGDSPAGTSVKTYEDVKIAVGTKSQIVLPLYNPSTAPNNWLDVLPDNVYISQLSIPGSVNAFSNFLDDESGYPGEGQEEMDQTQTLSVEDQFARGVRAFEIATERGSRSSGDLGSVGHVIAGTQTDITFGAAMERLADLIGPNSGNSREFVIVTPYYSPNSGEDVSMWANQLKNYLQNHSSVNGVEILPFRNSMTIGEARGKILFLSRMASSKATIDGYIGEPQRTTAIYGWNADKDRWRMRGYSDEWTGENILEYTAPTLEKWKYESATPGSTGEVNYYVQDWSRVCKADGSYSHQHKYLGTISSQSTTWHESKTEKIKNITDFMTWTIAALKNSPSASDVFINSLAGYYVVSNPDGVSAVPTSTVAVPGFAKHGDIPPFARDMNNEVYKYILGMDYESRGPLGIMLLNYVGDAEAFKMQMYGDYIVRALVDNNFRFPLSGSTQE